MLAPTRAESGCKLYELYESDTRGRFYLCETWASQAALDQHMTVVVEVADDFSTQHPEVAHVPANGLRGKIR